MKIVYGPLEAEVSTELVKISSLVDEPVIVELVNEHKQVCETCPMFAETKGNCPQFPFCNYVQVKQMTVPLYVTGVVDTEKGQQAVYQRGHPCETYNRVRYVRQRDGQLREVRPSDYRGYEVLPTTEGGIKIEERAPFNQSTKTIEIAESDLYPTGVEENFLVESIYEIYAKPLKDPSQNLRNIRKLYEIVKALAQKNGVAVKTGFVWKAGVYKSWAIILEPVMFDDGKFLLVMKTTGANLKWLHAMTVPPEVAPLPISQAPTVNNLKALGSFLDGVKKQSQIVPVEKDQTQLMQV